MGKAQSRPGSAGLGRAGLHSMRQMRHGLPARRYSKQGLRGSPAGRRARLIQIARGPTAGMERVELHPAGSSGGLHRLRDLRRRVPGAEQIGGALESDQYAGADAAPRNRARELELFPLYSGTGSTTGVAWICARNAGATAALRVLGRLRGVRGDALHQVAHPTLWRPASDRKRHRLLVHLRRESADHALREEQRRARPGLVEFAF